MIDFSLLDYWARKTVEGPIQVFTDQAAARIEVPVGKELRTLGLKFSVQD